MTTVFEHAWILTMDEQGTVYRDGYLAVKDGRIAELGEGTYPGHAETRIDARGGILLPGFVNTHCHASMVPFRSLGDDCVDRLRRFLFPLENEAMTRELTYLAARYAMAEMLLSGTTTFVDMYYFEDEVARACREMGIRGFVGESVIGQPTCDYPAPYGGFERCESMLREVVGEDLVRPIVALHGTTTCDAQAIRRGHELAVRYHAPLTLHVSEMDYEMKFFADMGTTPLQFMDSLGAVDEHLLAAHCIHLSDADVALLRDRGASVAHCIGSNTKAGKGVMPAKALHEAGVPFGLGTDGPSSGNTLSMFDQMRAFALFHKTANHDRSLFPAREIVAAATHGGACALHAENEFGSLKPGMKADVTLVSLDAPSMFPVYDPYSALVYSANASCVDTVMVSGQVRVRGGRLVDTTLDALRAAMAEPLHPFLRAAQGYADVL